MDLHPPRSTPPEPDASDRRRAWLRWTVIVVLGVVYLVSAAHQASVVNTGGTDQKAYLRSATEVRESGFTFTGYRNRMPAYPFLQAVFLDVDASADENLETGKRVNIGLSVVLLVSLAALFHARLRRPSADLLLAIVAFTVFVWRAGYYQCELVYYVLAFATWYAMGLQLRRPGWRGAAAIGVAAAATHLTKASVLPGLVVFLAVFVGGAFRDRRELGRRVLLGTLTVGLFLALLSPYLLESKSTYGRYFYNVNSTFYVWYDSWDECLEGTKAHGDRVGWPDMPEDEIPGPMWYLERHGPGDIAGRFLGGFEKNLGNLVERKSNHYGRFLVFGLLAAALLWRSRDRAPSGGDRSVRVFQIGWVAAYLSLYAWYAPIANGDRFLQSLVLPILYPVFLFFDSCEARSQAISIGGRRMSVRGVRVVLAVLLIAYLALEFPSAIRTRYSGA